MAKNLSLSGIQTGQAIEAKHVTQSIEAFTGAEAYDITVSGSLTVQGPVQGTAGTLNNFSSSYALTASYALNGGSGGGESVGTLQQVMESGSSTTIVITASAGISSSGNLITNQVLIKGGVLDIQNEGSPSSAKFYCENNNLHYIELKAQSHSLFTGNPTTLLPSYDFDFKKPYFQANITASGAISASGALFSQLTDNSNTSYKTVVIDPTTGKFYRTGSYTSGGSGFPFSGSAVITGSLVISSSNQDQTLQLYGSGSTIFSIEGSRGTLFSIDDDESDSKLFSVNNVSGTPVLEVHEDNTVKLGKQNGFGIVISGSNPLPNDADAKILITGSIHHSGSSVSFNSFVSASSFNAPPGVINQLTASYAISASVEVTKEISSSYADTASYVENAQTASYVLNANNATDLVVQVKNTQTSTILKGQVLHSVGVTGENIDVITASNNSATSMPGFAVANQDISQNSAGQAIISGKIKNIDTSGLTAGSNVYVNLNGGYTGTKPSGSSLIQNIGVVGKVNATEGELIILGAGRSNDVPNLLDNQIFFGSGSNQSQQIHISGALDSTIINNITASGNISASGYIIGNSITSSTAQIGNLTIQTGFPGGNTMFRTTNGVGFTFNHDVVSQPAGKNLGNSSRSWNNLFQGVNVSDYLVDVANGIKFDFVPSVVNYYLWDGSPTRDDGISENAPPIYSINPGQEEPTSYRGYFGIIQPSGSNDHLSTNTANKFGLFVVGQGGRTILGRKDYNRTNDSIPVDKMFTIYDGQTSTRELFSIETGSGATRISGSVTITDNVDIISSGSDIFNIQGSQGQLFNVDDDLLHNLFLVTDISGESLFKVSGSGLVEVLEGSITTPQGTINELTASHAMNIQPENNFTSIVEHSTNFTSTSSYAGRYNIVGGTLAITVTTGSENLSPGMEWQFFQTSSGDSFTFTSGTGVTVISRNNNKRLSQLGSTALLKYISGQTFHLVGDLTI